jgi:hypothetical protein
MEIKKYRYYIGIDTGVNTGFALWDAKEKIFQVVKTMKIHEALRLISAMYRAGDTSKNTFIRVEDARLRRWFGRTGVEKLQGAGSIKRDAVIWEDFLKDIGIDFEMVAPKENSTKMKSEHFAKLTKWKKPTNYHSRDAAMLVFAK